MANVSYVKTKTREGDTWDVLFNAYRSAFPPGTTVTQFAKDVTKANGVSYTTNGVEKWIFGLSGKRFPLDKKNNPGMYGGQAGVGWSFFGEGNEILLPNIPRAGDRILEAQPEPMQPVLAVKDNRVMLWALLGTGAFFLVVAALTDDKKKKGER